MLIIRLARRGRKKQAFYDVVVAEKARAVQKRYITKLGYYNPLTENGKGELVIDKDLTTKYIKNGAQVSQTAARLLVKNDIKEAGKFVEERVTKPKKEKVAPEPEAPKEEAPKEEAAPEAAPEEAPEETKEAAEAPAEEAVETPAEAPTEEVAEEKAEA